MKTNKNNLKKMKVMVIFSVVLLSFGWQRLLADRVMFSMSGGYLFPADSGYKEIYGRKIFVPEFKLGLRVFDQIYIYGNFFSFSKKGFTPELQEPAASRQQFLGGGLAYFPYLNQHWKAFLGVGVASISYREEAMEVTVSGHKLGFSVEGGIYYKEKFMFLGINGAYTSATSSYEGVSFKLGGARASILLGFML